jgi:coenzyme F420-reducing hydrogenase delta subunit
MRVREANNVLSEVGLGPCRVMLKQTEGSGQDLYRRAIEELLAETEKLGPNPIRGNGDK